VVENIGFLPTSGLALAERLGVVPPPVARLRCEGPQLVRGLAEVEMHHLDGWGVSRVSNASNPIYPNLAGRGHRAWARWIVKGAGRVTVSWDTGRGGAGEVEALL